MTQQFVVTHRHTVKKKKNLDTSLVKKHVVFLRKYGVKQGPASFSSGQGLLLLIMRSRVRFPVLPWEFFLAGKDSRGDHGLGS